MYQKFCNVPKSEPDVCPNVGWVKDFNDPEAILDIPFNGESIARSNNYNWPLLDDKAINRALDHARLITNAMKRARAYGRIDDQIMAKAPAIPWVWDNQANIESKNVRGVVNRFNAHWDLSFTSLKRR